LNQAYGADSFAIGKGSIATGDRAVAIGRSNKSGGNASFVIGQQNIAYNGSDTWIAATNSDEEEAAAANASFVGGRSNKVRGDATFMFGVENEEYEKGNSNFIVGQKNKVHKQTQSAILGGTNSSGRGTYTYIIGQGNNNNESNINELSNVMLLGFNLKNDKDSNKIVLGNLNRDTKGTVFEVGDGLGNYRHNAVEISADVSTGTFMNTIALNATSLKLNSSNISIPSSEGQKDWLTIKDNGNHLINITANSTAGLNISNGTNPVSVISGSLDLYATKGMTFRTHGATTPSLKITSGMDNKIETGERATFIANGKLRAMKAPTEANDVVRLGDIQKLLKLVDGLSNTQIATLNNFAKALTEV
jgi:hypothetical protein